MSDKTPNQVTSPDSASKPFVTDKDGVIYPNEMKRTAKEYLAGEGSMGFDRNLGVKRDGMNPGEVETLGMGQHNLQKLKSASAGSHAI